MTGGGADAAMAGGAVAAASWLAWAVRGRSAQIFGPSVWRGSRQRRAVALTFDDGPSESTPRLLEALAHAQVAATFFQLGANVDRLPEVARAVAAGGHEIGNHGYSHALLCFRSAASIESELRRAQEAITKRAGVRPRWFRPPFGARWFGLAEAQRRLGLTGVMWTAIGYDWKLRPDAVAERMATGARNGAILCLHDGRELRPRPDIGATIEAVERLIPRLREAGFRLETVGQLLCPTS
jgi:peptidoglycan/xylan/chitin deacetylase (PgdA/CDA1 family)